MTPIHHAFPPLCGNNPQILILGTFPSPLSRGKGEYYGNPRNQFWRIMFAVFDLPFDSPDYEAKKSILFSNGVALWDVITDCEAEGALDSSIRNPVYNLDLPSFIVNNKIHKVYFNGNNAYSFYRRGLGTIERRVLPSTSPANAGKSFGGKLSLWQEALRYDGGR